MAQINSACSQDSQISLGGCSTEYKGVSEHFKISHTKFWHSSYPIALFLWHINHLSPHRPPSEAQINLTCHQDCHISLCGCFDEYKREVTHLKSPILSFFQPSYPITLFGWHITHLSPHKSRSGAQINSTCPQNSQISLWGCLEEYKGKVTPLKSPIQSYFHSSYPITFFRWHITHLSPHRLLSDA